MIGTLRRKISVYTAYAVMMPKMYLAYSIWVWMSFIVQAMALVIFVAFWKAVYAGQAAIGGLDLQGTLNYIILAQLFLPVVYTTGTIYFFGELVREGRVAVELLRPMDFQMAQYGAVVARILINLALQIPLALVAWLLFRFDLPTDLRIWGAFLVTMLLGNAMLFFFDWILGCVAFYSTEIWGLSVLRFGIATFFSGSLVPLVMMPDWLQAIANTLPFSHALYYPVSILSGITPLADVPGIWLVQAAYLLVFGLLSRWVFRVSVRRVTVQGG